VGAVTAVPSLSLFGWDGGTFGSAGEAPRARVYFDAMQDRHVPVTPQLAIALARMERSRNPADIMPWGRAYELAGQALGLGGSFGRTSFWSSLTPTFVLELAEPLLRKAAQNVGSVPITLPGSGATDTGYRFACEKIEGGLSALLKTPEIAGQGFWSRAGVALLAAYWEKTQAARVSNAFGGLVRVEDRLPGLVFEIEPERPVKPDSDKRRKRPKMRSTRLRTGIRPREGGVDGIIHSRRLEDVENALISTFAFPREVLLMKLVDEGFLTTLRPPFRHPSRDVLSLAMNASSRPGGPAAVVKAAWADAAVRLGYILTNLDLARTEFGWVDMAAAGPVCSAVSVQGLPVQAGLDGSGLGGVLRKSLIARSTLMPDAFVTTPKARWQSRDLSHQLPEAAKQLIGECGRVAHVAGAASAKGPKRQPLRIRPDLSDYATVLAISIADGVNAAGTRVTDWHADRDSFMRGLHLTTARRLRIAQILVPETMGPGAVFRLASDFDQTEVSVSADPELSPNDALAALIGQLSEWFVELTVKAIDD